MSHTLLHSFYDALPALQQPTPLLEAAYAGARLRGWLELTAVVRALQAWAQWLRSRKVLVRCDCTQTVAAAGSDCSTRVREESQPVPAANHQRWLGGAGRSWCRR